MYLSAVEHAFRVTCGCLTEPSLTRPVYTVLSKTASQPLSGALPTHPQMPSNETHSERKQVPPETSSPASRHGYLLEHFTQHSTLTLISENGSMILQLCFGSLHHVMKALWRRTINGGIPGKEIVKRIRYSCVNLYLAKATFVQGTNLGHVRKLPVTWG